MLGLVTAKTVSKGRYGRSKEINSSIPNNIDPQQIMTAAEEEMGLVFTDHYTHQTSL